MPENHPRSAQSINHYLNQSHCLQEVAAGLIEQMTNRQTINHNVRKGGALARKTTDLRTTCSPALFQYELVEFTESVLVKRFDIELDFAGIGVLAIEV
jgi:hypothetical protein